MSKKRIVLFVLIGAVVLLMAVVVLLSARQSADTPDHLLSLGEKYLTELNYEQALVQFLKVIEIDPMNPRGYTGAAEAYVGLDRIDDAVTILQQGFSRTGDEGIREMLDGLLVVTDLHGYDETADAFKANESQNETPSANVNGDDEIRFYQASNPNTQGATASIGAQDDWVFFGGAGINRIRTNGTEKALLIDMVGDSDIIVYICVIDDWVYFTTFYDHLYKIRTDGTNLTQLSIDNCQYVYIFEDWIYYSRVEDHHSYLYKMRTDGTDETQLTEDYPDYHNIYVDGEWVYYQNISGQIMKIGIDGAGKAEIKKFNSLFDESDYFAISNGWIYYTNREGITKLRTDGSNEVRITNDSVGYNASDIIIENDWIYYKNDSDESKLYRIRTDGTERMKLCNDVIDKFYIAGNWIYYQNKDSSLCKINTSGEDYQMLFMCE